jgi:hypothetical protein
MALNDPKQDPLMASIHAAQSAPVRPGDPS